LKQISPSSFAAQNYKEVVGGGNAKERARTSFKPCASAVRCCRGAGRLIVSRARGKALLSGTQRSTVQGWLDRKRVIRSSTGPVFQFAAALPTIRNRFDP